MDHIYSNGLSQGEWIVSEKIHGSNFSLWMNKDGLRVAKRSTFLTDTESFFNWQTVVDAYIDHISLLYQYCLGMLNDLQESGYIKIVNPDENQIVLYGEIFGGIYNHPDVERVEGASRVQKGVQYCPWNDFYAFDLKINGSFINYDLFAEMMEEIGFRYSKALFRGTLEDCLKYPNDNPTTLPTIYGLPEIEGNISEGVVIKPNQARFFPTGERVILKNKNDKFKEKEEGCGKLRQPKEVIKLTEQENEILNAILEYVTENRLRNVLSKIGTVSDKMFGKVLGSFCGDIFEDVHKEQPELFNDLSKTSQKNIHKQVNKAAQEMIKQNFLNIIDNNF